MPQRSRIWLVLGLAVLAIAAGLALKHLTNHQGRKNMNDQGTGTSGLQLISPVFRDGTAIPPQYTCKGQNVNPPLNIIGVPAGAQSLALIMHDPDAVGSDFVHWLVWDIPASTETIAANSLPVGAIQGLNSAGQNRYMGPCPPAGTGTHRYMFEIYALDTSLNLSKDSHRADVQKAMKDHILEHSTLTGLFSAD